MRLKEESERERERVREGGKEGKRERGTIPYISSTS